MKNAKRYSNIFTVRVNEHNRLTIPKAIAKKYNIKQGDVVTVAVLEITKVSDYTTIEVIPKKVDRDAADYDEIYNEIVE